MPNLEFLLSTKKIIKVLYAYLNERKMWAKIMTEFVAKWL
jgi:hypothetical protein